MIYLYDMSALPNWRLFPIFLTVFIDLVGVGIVIPVLAPLFLSPASPLADPSWSFQTRTLLMGLLAACYPLAQFFGAPYLGALSDRWGRKPVLLASLAGTFIGYVLFALAVGWGKLWLLFLARILDGFTGGNIATAQSAISDVSTEETKARNFGLIGMAFGLGFILGPFLGGKLSDPSVASWFTLATPFWFAAGLCFINIVLVWIRFRETLVERLDRPMSLWTGVINIKKAFTLPSVRVMFLVVFLFMAGFNFYTQFSQVFLYEKFGFRQAEIGEYFAFIGVWIALVQGIITPVVTRYFKPRQIVSVSFLILALSLGALMLPEAEWQLYALTPLVALGMGLSQPNMIAIVSSLADRKSQGEILGINQSVQSLAIGTPPLFAGILAAYSIYLPIVGASVFVLAAWVVFVFVFSKQKPQVFQEA